MTHRRIPMEIQLPAPSERPPVVADGGAARTVREDDKEALAILLYAAYKGTIDDEGESFADALEEMAETWRGSYGRFLPECSFVVEDGEFLASACLVTYFEPHAAPLVVFLMTRPEAKRRGLARRLLERSMHALSGKGYDRLTLVVTEGNDPAQRLYRALGFRPIDAPAAQSSAYNPHPTSPE
jgi:ribosomal protein S18 acetylase RimI-like enzyme